VTALGDIQYFDDQWGAIPDDEEEVTKLEEALEAVKGERSTENMKALLEAREAFSEAANGMIEKGEAMLFYAEQFDKLPEVKLLANEQAQEQFDRNTEADPEHTWSSKTVFLPYTETEISAAKAEIAAL